MLPDLKLYCKSIVIKPVWYWHKKRDLDQQDRTANPGITPHFLQSTDFLSRVSTTLSGEGCLGGSVGWASDFSSGHDLTAHELEPHIGLSALSTEPAPDHVSPSLSAPPPLLSL